jgi:hypothetical protein
MPSSAQNCGALFFQSAQSVMKGESNSEQNIHNVSEGTIVVNTRHFKDNSHLLSLLHIPVLIRTLNSSFPVKT